MSGFEEQLTIEALRSNWVAPLGPMVDAFELEFKEYIGIAHAVALSSGTAALHLSLLVLGVSPGDEVLCPTLTFSASANAITYVRGVPVFIDSDRRSWNMDPDLLEEELIDRKKSGRLPRAVIAVDLYGQCADYERIERLCQENDIPLVEDAAEALGARCSGKRAGNFGAAAIFSFNGNKIITTSGGGMLVSSKEDLVKKARFLATQARDPAPHYQHSQIGYNYRMSNILAAIGRGQLAVIDDRVSRKSRIFADYRQGLADLPGIDFMPRASYAEPNYWLTVILIDPELFGVDREGVRLVLETENIESRPVWKPMHMQPVYQECRTRGGAVAGEIFEKGLCLPSGSSLDPIDQERIIEIIRRVRGSGKSGG
jgi:pyridoxal phosphate-dependent aminotransferase EpsN